LTDKKYKITLSETTNRKSQFLQIIADDQFSVNITLIGEFEIEDSRAKQIAEPEICPYCNTPYRTVKECSQACSR